MDWNERNGLNRDTPDRDGLIADPNDETHLDLEHSHQRQHHMAQVTKDIVSGSRTLRDEGNSSLLGGLLAKAVLFTGRNGEILAAHCEIDRLRPWVAGLVNQPARTLPAHLRVLIEQALATGQPINNREIIISSPSGIPEAFHLAASPNFDAADAVNGVTVALYDLAPVQEVSPNLGQLIRLASIGTLSAGLAHEIKNAMVAVNTFVDILVTKHQDIELAPIVAREIRRIDHIVGQMLRVSGPKKAELRPVHVHELLEHAISVTEHRLAGSRIVLDRQLDADPDLVLGEPSQLEQAFVNLLFNAVEAMGNHGTLTVATSLEHVDDTPLVRLVFGDTGAGIPPESLDRLFEPYFSTKPTGHGLGLSITKRIVLDHGGSIHVDSRPNEGTTFTIKLPSGARQP
jgi:two-component system nitrogen regulation sensor histidine kinase GlnL